MNKNFFFFFLLVYIMSNSQRAYCFTSFANQEPIFNPEEVRYMIFQQEECPETYNLHYQGYVEFYRKITMKTAFKILGFESQGRFFIRKGTRQQARAYCMKSETQIDFPKEFGDFRAGGQGARCDLKQLIDDIKEGKSDFELMEQDPQGFKENMKFIGVARSLIKEEDNRVKLEKKFSTTVLNENQEKWWTWMN